MATMENAVKTIYVVTWGSYSEYGICAMFSRREDAEHYIEIHFDSKSSDEFNIEEWPLDQHREAEWVPVYQAEILMCNGKLTRREPTRALSTDLIARQTNVQCNDWYDRLEYHRAIVSSGISQEHADKVAVEERQKWLRTKGVGFDEEAYQKRLEEMEKALAHPVHSNPYYWSEEK